MIYKLEVCISDSYSEVIYEMPGKLLIQTGKMGGYTAANIYSGETSCMDVSMAHTNGQ